MSTARVLVSTLVAGALVTQACGSDADIDADTVPSTAAVAVGDGDADEFVIDEPAATGSSAGNEWYRPPVGATWQWQLSGEVDTSYDVDVYDVDLFDVPAEQIADIQASGAHVVCYFSAGSVEEWRTDAGDFPASVQGEPLDGWEGERWLDVRSPAVLDAMVSRLDLAAGKGCDGVEPDNVQAYHSDTGFDLTADDQVAFNAALADAAHERGLAIGLKNAAELIPDLLDRFDFSVNEECHEYDECEPYSTFTADGKPVFNAEYAAEWADDAGARAELCDRAAAAGTRTLVLPLDLDGTFRHACDG